MTVGFFSELYLHFAEKKIIESGINYSLLRAGLLTEEEGSGKIDVA